MASVKMLHGSFHYGINVRALQVIPLRDEDADHGTLLKMVFDALGVSAPHMLHPLCQPLLQAVPPLLARAASHGAVQENEKQFAALELDCAHWPQLFWQEVGNME